MSDAALRETVSAKLETFAKTLSTTGAALTQEEEVIRAIGANAAAQTKEKKTALASYKQEIERLLQELLGGVSSERHIAIHGRMAQINQCADDIETAFNEAQRKGEADLVAATARVIAASQKVTEGFRGVNKRTTTGAEQASEDGVARALSRASRSAILAAFHDDRSIDGSDQDPVKDKKQNRP